MQMARGLDRAQRLRARSQWWRRHGKLAGFMSAGVLLAAGAWVFAQRL
jgi:hypothetical protein